MSDTLQNLISEAQIAFEAAADAASLENAKAKFLGKQGALTELIKGLAKLDVEQKKTEGARINAAKQSIEAALNAKRQALADAPWQKS